MIVKELDAFVNGDTLAKAGRKAEESLAHYLNRAFKSSPDFLVFNGLRLEKEGDAAQIDHLVLHRYGFIIVESKSVASRVRINEQEEWARLWNGSWRGMPSPIKQAERQGEFLREILQAQREQLRNKAFFGLKQGGFLSMPIDVVVAISDSGMIDRPRSKNALLEVCKADQVSDCVQAIHARYKKSEHSLLLRDFPYTLVKEEVDRISTFLLQSHSPLRNGPDQPERNEVRESVAAYPTPSVTVDPEKPLVAPVTAPTILSSSTALKCRHCSAERVDVVYGRYGYYLKCLDCDGNTPLNRTCRQCGGKEKTRKDGRRFFAECAACSSSYVFHENAHN